LRENGQWKNIGYAEAVSRLTGTTRHAAAGGKDRVRMLTAVEGDVLLHLFAGSLVSWWSSGPVIYEPLSCDHLKEANQAVYGFDGLPSYRMESADLLVGFGADFLETWLSPVEYARRFKSMHAYAGGGKNRFFHVSPCRGLTGANADIWISCAPGTETAVCLGLIREMMRQKPPDGIPSPVAASINRIAGAFDRQRVIDTAGIDPDLYDQLRRSLRRAKSPLVLGTAALSRSRADLQAHIAVNLLNYVLDPALSNIDFTRRHRMEKADSHDRIADFFMHLAEEPPDVLFLNNVNPAYALPPGMGVSETLRRDDLFVVCFSNFMDETAALADMVFPLSLPLESWEEYSGVSDLVSFCQPAMKPLYNAPQIGDVFLRIAPEAVQNGNTAKQVMISRIKDRWPLSDTRAWLAAVRSGGVFGAASQAVPNDGPGIRPGFEHYFEARTASDRTDGLALAILPSIRLYDGRGANQPWLCEVPDPVTKVAWQSPLMVHPETARQRGIRNGELARLTGGVQSLTAPVYETENIRPGVVALQAGQGHHAYGRYARGRGANPFSLLMPESDASGGPGFYKTGPVEIEGTGQKQKLAHTDGSMEQHGRKIAMAVTIDDLEKPPAHEKPGLAMHEFPLTLPLPEGYNARRDFYTPHDHDAYRWAMVVDLDRCIGCSACMAACYAENNVGVVGEQQMINGREMSWIHIERYQQIGSPQDLIFLPMLCQHCDNAPCEMVCPVYAPHHNKEGLNNQIYNRCIGTRFCAQNCPYKVRKFNWFEWQWPEPLSLQLNPDVTVRTKGVMEKCSFCVQRIKDAHDAAKNENRMIRDGEITPACVQTCPTDALVFGSLMDESSRVSQLVHDRRAYQVMGYLNTKPAVIYLRKVVYRNSADSA
ncbi:MAG: 4Fe-4S dicluster domain-containing protein, partial [Desulfobacteraceae bacterium]|nr:4Fe-4S dicluster domain-containing protein [Desulfobacteraceae bacterium]